MQASYAEAHSYSYVDVSKPEPLCPDLFAETFYRELNAILLGVGYDPQGSPKTGQ